MSKVCPPLLNWLKNIPPPFPKCLTWCHTTDAWALREIIMTKYISPAPCPIFNEDLAYYFYGRPAFRIENGKAQGQSSTAPVVIILHSHLINNGKRLFPFDTGAFAAKSYEKWMHPAMTISDFELQCTDQIPPIHVRAFFDSNDDYLKLNSRPVAISYDGEFEVESMIQLLNDSNVQADDRRLSMELQTTDKTLFTSSNVLALIIPHTLVEAAWFVKFMESDGVGIELITYEHSHKKQAIHFQSELEGKAIELQKKRDLI